MAVDATARRTVETPIERPAYEQRRYYSGKQKDHTLKAQVSIALKSRRQVLACAFAFAFAPGRVHDLTLCRDHLHDVSVAIPCLFDKGYQGIQYQRARAYLPFTPTPGQPLSREQCQVNRLHAAIRIRVEQVIRSLKRFRILAGHYRNRRRRFGLRFNLIAAIHNFELGLAS